jgi:hypothetical protein
LRHAVQGFERRCRDRGLPLAPGQPRRTAVVVALRAAQYLCQHALPGLAAAALDVAAKAETAAVAKAAGLPKSRPRRYGSAARAAAAAAAEAAAASAAVAARGGSGGEPAEVRQLRLSCAAQLALLRHAARDALPLAEACQPEPIAAYAASGQGSGGESGVGPRGARGHMVAAAARTLLGDVKHALGDAQGAAAAYADALERRRAAFAAATPQAFLDPEGDEDEGPGPDPDPDEGEDEALRVSPVPPLRVLVRLATLKLSLGDFEGAKKLFLEGTQNKHTVFTLLSLCLSLPLSSPSGEPSPTLGRTVDLNGPTTYSR